MIAISGACYLIKSRRYRCCNATIQLCITTSAWKERQTLDLELRFRRIIDPFRTHCIHQDRDLQQSVGSIICIITHRIWWYKHWLSNFDECVYNNKVSLATSVLHKDKKDIYHFMPHFKSIIIISCFSKRFGWHWMVVIDPDSQIHTVIWQLSGIFCEALLLSLRYPICVLYKMITNIHASKLTA